MEDKVLSEREIHWIVTIFQMDSNITLNKNVLCGALGLTLGEREEIASRIQMDRAGVYDYLSLGLNKWIGLNSGRATLKSLIMILRQEYFNSTADKLLNMLESLPNPDTQDNTAEVNARKVKKSNKIEPVRKSWPSGVTSGTTEKDNEVPSTSKVSSEDSNPKEWYKVSNQIQRVSPLRPKVTEVHRLATEFDEQISLKSTEIKKTCNKLKQVQLEDSQQSQTSSSEQLINLHGSQTQLHEFLKFEPQKLNTLRSIEFNNIKMSWSHFWNSVEHLKNLEIMILTNLHVLGIRTHTPTQKRLLPNLRVYAVKLDRISSHDLSKTLNEIHGNPGERKYLLEALVPFAKNEDEEIWTTCLSLHYIQLKLEIPPYNVIFKIDKDNLEFVSDRSFVEYNQTSSSTQRGVLSHFLQTFQELKRLKLTNYCGVVTRLFFSTIPSSITHLTLVDDPNSINGEEFDVALKSFKDLIFLNISDTKFYNGEHKINVASLSPEIRYLVLTNVNIITCSTPCEFNHLSWLYFNNSHFNSSVNVPLMFKNVKKCYLRESPLTSPPSKGIMEFFIRTILTETSRVESLPFSGLNKLLDINTLELIVIDRLRIDQDDEVRKTLSTSGVPPNAEFFAMEKNIKGQWKFKNLSKERAISIYEQATEEGWLDTGKSLV